MRIPVKVVAAERLRKPDWIRVRAPSSPRFVEIKKILREHSLHTVCEEASCPNIGECFSNGTATFMIMGDVCTRRCPFCDVGHGRPLPLDADEPAHLATTIAALKLSYVVVTSVDRDDLRDGGAQHFADCIRAVRERSPRTQIEVLVPDFRGRLERALDILAATPPDVMNHNLETVPRLYRQARPGADYAHSLALLREFRARVPGVPTKSGLMVGLGETDDEILAVMRDMRAHGIEMLTIGQYLQPTGEHLPVLRYVHPDTFAHVRARGLCDGLPPRGGRRAGALVVPRRQAGGRRARARRRLIPPQGFGAGAAGNGAPFGHSSHIRPSCRIRPASRPASTPNPQKKSARTAPRIAPPVSCASTRRFSGVVDSGHVVARKTGAPSGTERVSDRDRAPGRERNAERADRPVDGGLERTRRERCDLAEEHVARIFLEQRGKLRRIGARPRLDALHRRAIG